MQISQKNLLFYENKGLIIAIIMGSIIPFPSLAASRPGGYSFAIQLLNPLTLELPLPLACNERAVGMAFAMPINVPTSAAPAATL